VYTDIDDVTGDGDNVVIDVRAAGVCVPDLLLSKGEYQLKLPPPFVVVRSAHPESGFREGERVSVFGILGGYAEQVAVPVANVIRSPAELDDAEAVSLWA
jgi:NADPH:quinone reductase